MKRKNIFLSLALASLGSIQLAGCSSPQVTSSASLPLTLLQPETALAMRSAGIEQAFRAYWSAYQRRDWAARFAMEQFTGEVKENFYMQYHNAAWNIMSFDVVRVHPADEKGRVRVDVQVSFQNPVEITKTSSSLVQDWWQQVDGVWRHISTDPMLNGMKPVL